MRNTSGFSPGWYARADKWPDGKARWSGHVRWTIHTPDGELVAIDSTGPALDGEQRPIDIWLLNLNEAGDDRRIRAIVPAQHVDSSASIYDMRILQVDRVPPPASPNPPGAHHSADRAFWGLME